MRKSILILLLFTFSIVSSQTRNLIFKSYSIDNGLSDNYAEQVFEDSHGFIWVATHNGLNRFDGHSFKKIEFPVIGNNLDNKMAKNFVNSIVEDRDSKLWISTMDGVYVYDLNKTTFSCYKANSNDKNSIISDFTEKTEFDFPHFAWVGTKQGLSKIDIHSKKVYRFETNQNDINSLPSNNISDISIEEDGSLWIGTRENGLAKLNKDKKTFTRYFNRKGGIPSVSIRQLFIDSEKNLWVVTSDQGLFCKLNGESSFFRIPISNSLTKKEIVTVFSCMSEDNDGNLWIGSSTDGLIVLNKKTKETSFYSENTQYPHAICGNSVEHIFKDKIGNMWISTHGGGISLYCPITSKILYRYKTTYKNALPGNIVSCFCEDQTGNVWIGTDGNGISKYNPRDDSFENYSKVNGLTSNAVLAISEIGKDLFAIATWNGGLNIFNAKDKQFRQYLFESLKGDAKTQDIYGLYHDKKHNWLWCNTLSDGIHVFDCEKMSFLSIKELNSVYPKWNDIKYSTKIVFETDGNSWIGGGYELGRISQNTITQYNSSDSTNGCISSNMCNDILFDSRGKLWVAAFNGLNVYNKKTDCFNDLKFKDLRLTEAKALLEDSHVNIWISSANGVYKYSTQSNTLKNMTLNWGIPEMQYYRKSAYRTHNGYLYFGGLKGFIVLHEDSSFNYNINPPLCITKLFIRNVEQNADVEGSPIKSDISTYQSITLNHDQSFITLEYAALDYIDNAKIQFKYKLEGFDKDWISAGNDRKANYTNIPPGTYTFLLLSTNSDGLWSKNPLRLIIKVLPPWWKTIWAITVFVLILISGFVLLILYRERLIKNENKKLEKLVDSKMQELKTINEILTVQNDKIQDNYEDLREKQLVIEIKNNQLQEALNVKDKLMTVIAHDFRNPLTTMQCFAKLLSEKIKSRGLIDLEPNIDAITISANTLQTQMIDVLEWSICRDNAANYKPKDVDLTLVMGDVLSLVSETTSHKKITVEKKYSISSHAFVDSRMISTVFRNLIINSTKFTLPGGSIFISICETDDWAEIIVKDTGIGMNQEQIDILLSDKNLLSNDYRSGFGIQICRTFIKRNKGLLQISSQIGKGSQFTILLPKGKELLRTNRFDESDDEKQVQTVLYENEESQSILIIDDNKELTNYLKEVFAEYFSVYEAFNGRDGLKMAQDILPDIILSDINMPLLDGKELCGQLKNNSLTNHIPIILISGKNLPQDQVEGLLKGADDYILKPFNVSVLKQKVFSILKNREILLRKLNEKKTVSADFKLPESIDNKLIDDITKTIIDNITNPTFDVEKLAKDVGMSRSQLYRKTKAVLGLSPIDYINNLKFQKSIEMLKTGKYRISEIAYELGFSDARYFSSSFAKRFGVPPSSFIAKGKNDSDF